MNRELKEVQKKAYFRS